MLHAFACVIFVSPPVVFLIQRFIIFVLKVKLPVLVSFAIEGGQKTSVHKLHVYPFVLRLL